MADLSRWLIRSVFAVYGYDVGYGIVDEGWGVAPMAVDDGLEPALLERMQPQLLLTSTSHPKATALMTVRRDAALEQLDDPTDTLLLDWGAPDGCEVGDRHAWRLASPHWTPARERLLESALRRLMTGKDIDPDGLDPETSFKAQYLNAGWPDRKAKSKHWLPEAAVAECGVDEVTVAGPLVAAVEVSVDGQQWSAAASDGFAVRTIVGRPLPEVCAWVDGFTVSEVLCHQAVQSRLPQTWNIRNITVGEASAATSTLADAVKSRDIRWDNPDPMAVQFGRVVAASGAGGPRIGDRLSRGAVEAVKATAWAYWRATTAPVESPAVF